MAARNLGGRRRPFFLEVFFYRVRVTLYGLSEIGTIRNPGKIFDRNVFLNVKVSLTFYLTLWIVSVKQSLLCAYTVYVASAWLSLHSILVCRIPTARALEPKRHKTNVIFNELRTVKDQISSYTD